MNEKQNSILTTSWVYFAATFAWTWLLWGTVIVLNLGSESTLGLILLLLGVTGPMVTGISFVYLTLDKEERRDYWQRVISFKRIPFRWYLVIIFMMPILNFAGAGLDLLVGGDGAVWGEAALNLFTDPLSIIFSLLFATLIPFIEELGWRGYVLDRLQAKQNALNSSLILGAVWSVWHLPLFFVPGTYQAGLGIGTLAFWLFFIGIIPLNLIFSWIYNNTNRSTLAVILFHGMVNFSGEIIALTKSADVYFTLLLFVPAIAIILIWGAKTFTGESKPSLVSEPV